MREVELKVISGYSGWCTEPIESDSLRYQSLGIKSEDVALRPQKDTRIYTEAVPGAFCADGSKIVLGLLSYCDATTVNSETIFEFHARM